MDRAKLELQAAELFNKYSEKWGFFRRYIASNPLTGFWIGVGCGIGATVILRILL